MRHRFRWLALVALGLAALACWYLVRSAPPPSPPPPVQVILGDPASPAPDAPAGSDAVPAHPQRQRATDRAVELEATQPKKDPCDPSDPMCGGL